MYGYLTLAIATCSVLIALLTITLIIIGMMFMGLMRRFNKIEYAFRTHKHATQTGKPGWIEIKETNGM